MMKGGHGQTSQLIGVHSTMHSCQVLEFIIGDMALENKPHPLPRPLPYVILSNLTKMWVWSKVWMS